MLSRLAVVQSAVEVGQDQVDHWVIVTLKWPASHRGDRPARVVSECRASIVIAG
jgi:hypothetical protein